MRPETITSWDRGRDQDQLLWDRDRDQKSGLETLTSLIWSRYLGNICPELQLAVDVLKNMLMFREDKNNYICSRGETELLFEPCNIHTVYFLP